MSQGLKRRQLTQDEVDLCGFGLMIASLNLTIQRSVAIAMRSKDEAERLIVVRDQFDALTEKIRKGEIIGSDAVET